MKKNSAIDYFGYIILRALGPLIRMLPRSLALFLGRRLGDFLYCFDLRHKSVAYANIKTAFRGKLTLGEVLSLTHDFYQAMGQNIMDLFFIPLVDKGYIDKYVHFQGLSHIAEAFQRKKGVIILSMHAGSWELGSVICAHLGFPYRTFVAEQRYPYLDRLLNAYRIRDNSRIIQREGQLAQLILALKNNEAVGMTVDQGGRFGTAVTFFGRSSSMASGAVRLALKHDAAILPVFSTRIKGPHLKIIIQPPFTVNRTPDRKRDIQDNLQELVRIFEGQILKHPQEYLWTYKAWKYSQERNILLLSDGKAGHLRQVQAVGRLLSGCLKDMSIKAAVDTVEVKFSSRWSRKGLTLCSILAGEYCCQGCGFCLRKFLEKDTYRALSEKKPDIIVSCGSSVAGLNYILSRQNLAKSIAVLRPSVLSVRRFNLVIMPRHDRPPRKRNVLATEAALNLLDQQYIQAQAEQLLPDAPMRVRAVFSLGVLIGGSAKGFCLKPETMQEVLGQIKSAAEKLNADILLTTSRRTSAPVAGLLKSQLKEYPRCRLLVIANEKNTPFAVGGILGLSRIVVVSPESISMVSEAVSSNRYVVVFQAGVSPRHRRFLDYMAEKKYIYLSEPQGLAGIIEDLWQRKPKLRALQDADNVRRALSRVI